MKVLWITNIVFPEVYSLLGELGANSLSSGSWMISLAELLKNTSHVNLTIVSVSGRVSKLTYLSGDRISFIIIPQCRRVKQYEVYMCSISQVVHPDVVHIHGTERPYGKAWIDVCPNDNVVVSIQGLMSAISENYLAGLSWMTVIKNTTIKDVFRSTIFQQKRSFARQGQIEKHVLRQVNHVIGRTDFDKAHCLAVNPSIIYHYCSETLRPAFYTGEWRYSECKPHSIFISQATYPIKGFHQVLKAVSHVIQRYPDTSVRVAGYDITNRSTIYNRLHCSGYGKFLFKLINELGLESRVVFLGVLDAEGMKRELERANLFITPSVIENSPNSLGEAQVIGVPVLASYVGGVPSMMRGDDEHLYQYDDTEVLAYKICQVFERRDTIDTKKMKDIAIKRHNPSSIVSQLLAIYESITE